MEVCAWIGRAVISPIVWMDALNVHTRGSSGCETLTLTLTLTPPHLFQQPGPRQVDDKQSDGGRHEDGQNRSGQDLLPPRLVLFIVGVAGHEDFVDRVERCGGEGACFGGGGGER